MYKSDLKGIYEIYNKNKQSTLAKLHVMVRFYHSVYLLLSRSFKQVYRKNKAALLFWLFGDFRCGVPLFIDILVIYKYKSR